MKKTIISKEEIYKEIGIRLKFILIVGSNNAPCDGAVCACIGEYAADIADLYAILKENYPESNFVFIKDRGNNNEN